MRALALLIIAAAALPLAACRDDRPADPTVEIDPCVSDPVGPACHKAEAEQACAESSDKPRCVADYLNTYPPTAAEKPKLPEPDTA